MFFFLFSSLWTPPTFKPHSFLIHFNRFYVLGKRHLKFYKSSLNSNNSKATYIQGVFLSVQEPAFVVFSDLFFKEFLTPFTLGGCNFLISNPFSTIVCVQMCQEEGFKFCLNTRNNGALPLDPAYPSTMIILLSCTHLQSGGTNSNS
jgi:hypothetical protein